MSDSFKREVIFPLLVVGALVVFFVVPFTEAGSLAQFAIGSIVKGFRVGPKTTSADDIEIDQNPYDLAEASDLDIDTYAGARVISSEEGNSPVMHQLAVGWATLNNARTRGATVFEYATDGSFGRQGGGRPVSTFLDPYRGHVTLFQGILNGDVGDPTNGATMWVAPKAQDALHARNPVKYKSFDVVNASRLADGFVPVDIAGVDSALLVMYRKA